MSGRLSKRANEGRRWRVNARQKRRLNTIIAKYIEEKHKDIHSKCVMFYHSVVGKYSAVQNLTKTFEFRAMIETETSNSEQQERPQAEAVVSEQQGRPQAEAVVSEQQERPQAEAVVSEQQERPQAEAVVSEQQERPQAEAVVSEPQNEITVTPGYTYIEPGLIMNEYVINNQDILSESVNTTIGEFDEGIDRLADMETIINNIVRDLEHVEPSIFEDLYDEGLGLNTEEEVGNMLNDYNIDNMW